MRRSLAEVAAAIDYRVNTYDPTKPDEYLTWSFGTLTSLANELRAAQVIIDAVVTWRAAGDAFKAASSPTIVMPNSAAVAEAAATELQAAWLRLHQIAGILSGLDVQDKKS